MQSQNICFAMSMQKEIGEVIEFIKKGNLYLSYRTFIGGV